MLEQRERPPPVACDERNGARSQIGRMLEPRAVVHEPIDGYSQPLEPGSAAPGRREAACSSRSPSVRLKTLSIISSAFIASFIPDALCRLRHLLEFLQRGVQARLHGSDRNLQDIGDFTILEVLVIGQDQRLAKGIRQPRDAVSHPLLSFGFLKFSQRPFVFADQQIDQVAARPPRFGRRSPADRGSPSDAGRPFGARPRPGESQSRTAKAERTTVLE